MLSRRARWFKRDKMCRLPCQRKPFVVKVKHLMLHLGLREHHHLFWKPDHPDVNAYDEIDIGRCSGTCGSSTHLLVSYDNFYGLELTSSTEMMVDRRFPTNASCENRRIPDINLSNVSQRLFLNLIRNILQQTYLS